MNCIIVDDEPNAIDVLKRYILQVPSLKLVQTFRNPVKAIDLLHEQPVDLVFLDINMPNLSGVQFVRSLEKKPMIIFTTAYSEYAVVSYELNAVDYLVKPIEFDRFIKAINKASGIYQSLTKKSSESKTDKETSPDNLNYVLLKSGPLTHKVNLNDILFIEKQVNYLSFQTVDKQILVRANMSEVFDYVPESRFCRVHKSFVVALEHIDTLETHRVSVKSYKILIGSSYREDMIKKMK